MTLRLIHSLRQTVERVAEARLPTETGEFRIIGFRSLDSEEEFVALVKGDLRPDRASLVRIHSQCMTGDVFGSVKCDCGRQLQAAMKLIEQEGHGAIVYQQQEGRGIGIINKIRAYALQEQGADTVEANERLGFPADLRDYRVGLRILRALGVRSTRLLSNNPRKLAGVTGEGLSVSERLPIEIAPNEVPSRYLKAKKEKLGHLLSSV